MYQGYPHQSNAAPIPHEQIQTFEDARDALVDGLHSPGTTEVAWTPGDQADSYSYHMTQPGATFSLRHLGPELDISDSALLVRTEDERGVEKMYATNGELMVRLAGWDSVTGRVESVDAETGLEHNTDDPRMKVNAWLAEKQPAVADDVVVGQQFKPVAPGERVKGIVVPGEMFGDYYNQTLSNLVSHGRRGEVIVDGTEARMDKLQRHLFNASMMGIAILNGTALRIENYRQERGTDMLPPQILEQAVPQQTRQYQRPPQSGQYPHRQQPATQPPQYPGHPMQRQHRVGSRRPENSNVPRRPGPAAAVGTAAVGPVVRIDNRPAPVQPPSRPPVANRPSAGNRHPHAANVASNTPNTAAVHPGRPEKARAPEAFRDVIGNALAAPGTMEINWKSDGNTGRQPRSFVVRHPGTVFPTGDLAEALDEKRAVLMIKTEKGMFATNGRTVTKLESYNGKTGAIDPMSYPGGRRVAFDAPDFPAPSSMAGDNSEVGGDIIIGKEFGPLLQASEVKAVWVPDQLVDGGLKEDAKPIVWHNNRGRVFVNNRRTGIAPQSPDMTSSQDTAAVILYAAQDRIRTSAATRQPYKALDGGKKLPMTDAHRDQMNKTFGALGNTAHKVGNAANRRH